LPKQMPMRKIVAITIGLAALILIAASLLLHWWTIHTTQGSSNYQWYNIDQTQAYPLTEGEYIVGDSYVGGSMVYAVGYDVPVLCGIVIILLIISIVFVMLFLISVYLCKSGRVSRSVPLIIGIITMLLLISAPLLFMMMLPVSIENDHERLAELQGREYEPPDHDHPSKSFFGSYEAEGSDEANVWYSLSNEETLKQQWGGDLGWMLAFLSLGMFLVSFVELALRNGGGPPEPPDTKYDREEPKRSRLSEPRPFYQYDEEERGSRKSDRYQRPRERDLRRREFGATDWEDVDHHDYSRRSPRRDYEYEEDGYDDGGWEEDEYY